MHTHRMVDMRRMRRSCALTLTIVVAACARDRAPDERTGTPADTFVNTDTFVIPPARDTAESAIAFPADSGTAGITEREPGAIPSVILRDVRTAQHAEFDRVVFVFDGDELPGYHIEYIDKPVIQCGSGDPIPVAGDAWLAVRLEPANAHEGDTTMVATVRDRNRTLELNNLRQLVLTCDFEAQVEWVLGLRSPNHYRVLELREPTRLVIDVRHRRN